MDILRASIFCLHVRLSVVVQQEKVVAHSSVIYSQAHSVMVTSEVTNEYVGRSLTPVEQLAIVVETRLYFELKMPITVPVTRLALTFSPIAAQTTEDTVVRRNSNSPNHYGDALSLVGHQSGRV